MGILLICLANAWVFALTDGRTYTKISKIPPREIALVLGTSPKMRSGQSNPYFTKRMDAAVMKNAPMVETMFIQPHPGRSG